MELIRELIDKLNYYTAFYDAGNPLISDKEWDDMYFKLQELEREYECYYPDSPTQHIDYEVVSALQKVTHSYPMLSLDKTKDLEVIADFIGTKSAITMLKMDGLSCALTYEGGKLVRAETRGNGVVGEDITHNARVVSNIPQNVAIHEKFVVHGEIICKYDDFKSFESEFKNPRNFAAGSIRLLDNKECARRKLTFIGWDVKGLNYKTMQDGLYGLMTLGFDVVPSVMTGPKGKVDVTLTSVEEGKQVELAQLTVTCDTNIVSKVIEKLRSAALNMNYPIDGLVFRYNDLAYGESLGMTGHHPKHSLALKFYDETYTTKLIGIEWQLGRGNALCPVAVFEPVEANGSVISRASLHNVSVMEEMYPLPWYVGCVLEVAKMNEIIPQVLNVEDPEGDERIEIEVPDFCSECGSRLAFHEMGSGVRELWCENEECGGKFLNRAVHFCSKKGMDIKGLSKATLEKLIDWGWVTTVKDLYDLDKYKGKWVRKPGFGATSVQKCLVAIEESKSAHLAQFISALGIPLIGLTVAKDISARVESWDEFIKLIEDNYDFTQWMQFGPEMSRSLKEFDYAEAKEIAKKLTFITDEEPTSAPKTLEGKNIVVTGKLQMFKNRDELKQQIESYGGKVTGSISKNTFVLINNDMDSGTAKNQSAKNLGIPIMSEAEFVNKFLVDFSEKI